MWGDVRAFAERAPLAQSIDELSCAFGQVIKAWGFDAYACIQLASRQKTAPYFGATSGQIHSAPWPRHYQEIGHVNWNDGIARIMSSTEPFWWSDVEIFSTLCDRQLIFGELADCEPLHSLIVPVRPPNGSVWGCALSNPHFDDRSELKSATVAAATSYVTRVALLLQAKSSEPMRSYCLTPRQREVVTWLARGMTICEISIILGTSARTVAHQLDDAKRRLQARTLPSLVAEAIMLGEVNA